MKAKNTFCYLLFILFVYLFSLNNVFAAVSYEFNVQPDKTVLSKNQIAKFDFSINSFEVDGGIVGCRFSITSDENITVLRDALTIDSNNWILEDTEDNRNYILKRKDTSLSTYSEDNNKVALSLPVRVAKTGTVQIKNIACYKSQDDYEEKTDRSISLKVSDLSSIKINGEEKIETDTNFYNEPNINAESFQIVVTTTDSEKQDLVKIYALDLYDAGGNNCEGNVCTKNQELTSCRGGNCTINYSDNFTAKKVLGSSNNFKEVKLAIYIGEELVREQLLIQKEIPNVTTESLSLKSLKINGFDINLSEDITTYEITLDGTTENVIVDATLEDTINAEFEENNGPREFDYKPTSINLIVKSKTGTNYKTYTINFLYSELPSSSSSSSSSSEPIPSTPSSSSSSQGFTNPQTGGIIGIFVGFMLIISLGVSFAIYQKNINKEIEE